MTIGALTVLLLNILMEGTSSRAKRLKVAMGPTALPEIDAFLQDYATQTGLNDESTDRLRAVGEETVSSLLPQGRRSGGKRSRNLTLSVRRSDDKLELEFMTTSDEDNLEDRLAYLSDQPRSASSGKSHTACCNTMRRPSSTASTITSTSSPWRSRQPLTEWRGCWRERPSCLRRCAAPDLHQAQLREKLRATCDNGLPRRVTTPASSSASRLGSGRMSSSAASPWEMAMSGEWRCRRRPPRTA